MKFTVISLYPQLILEALQVGVVGQAFAKKRLGLETINPRDWAEGVHKAVDDRPFGGGDGMVMGPEVLHRCLTESFPEPQGHFVYLSPQGRLLNEKKVIELSTREHVVLLSGRYGGIDQRLLNHWVDEEISIGDYVVSGGELPALVLIDAVARKVPGVLGHQDSSSKDSLAQGLLEEPMFTRPWEWRGEVVPEVLKSGHHQKIQDWKKQMSVLVTAMKRPDLLPSLSPDEIKNAMKLYHSMTEAEKKVCGLDPEFRGVTSWKASGLV